MKYRICRLQNSKFIIAKLIGTEISEETLTSRPTSISIANLLLGATKNNSVFDTGEIPKQMRAKRDNAPDASIIPLGNLSENPVYDKKQK